MPAIVELPPGVQFRSRPHARRTRELRPLEVAALEVLADPLVAEVSLEQLEARIKELISTGVVRCGVLVDEANDETRPIVRTRMAVIAGLV